MLAFTSNHKHEAALLALQEALERAERPESLARARQTALFDYGKQFERKNQELADAQARAEAAERACQVAEEGDYVLLFDAVRLFAAHKERILPEVPLVGLERIPGESFFHGQIIQELFQQILIHDI